MAAFHGFVSPPVNLSAWCHLAGATSSDVEETVGNVQETSRRGTDAVTLGVEGACLDAVMAGGSHASAMVAAGCGETVTLYSALDGGSSFESFACLYPLGGAVESVQWGAQGSMLACLCARDVVLFGRSANAEWRVIARLPSDGATAVAWLGGPEAESAQGDGGTCMLGIARDMLDVYCVHPSHAYSYPTGPELRHRLPLTPGQRKRGQSGSSAGGPPAHMAVSSDHSWLAWCQPMGRIVTVSSTLDADAGEASAHNAGGGRRRVNSKRHEPTLLAHSRAVTSLAWMPHEGRERGTGEDGTAVMPLLTACLDGSVRLYRVHPPPKRRQHAFTHANPVSQAAPGTAAAQLVCVLTARADPGSDAAINTALGHRTCVASWVLRQPRSQTRRHGGTSCLRRGAAQAQPLIVVARGGGVCLWRVRGLFAAEAGLVSGVVSERLICLVSTGLGVSRSSHASLVHAVSAAKWAGESVSMGTLVGVRAVIDDQDGVCDLTAADTAAAGAANMSLMLVDDAGRAWSGVLAMTAGVEGSSQDTSGQHNAPQAAAKPRNLVGLRAAKVRLVQATAAAQAVSLGILAPSLHTNGRGGAGVDAVSPSLAGVHASDGSVSLVVVSGVWPVLHSLPPPQCITFTAQNRQDWCTYKGRMTASSQWADRVNAAPRWRMQCLMRAGASPDSKCNVNDVNGDRSTMMQEEALILACAQGGIEVEAWVLRAVEPDEGREQGTGRASNGQVVMSYVGGLVLSEPVCHLVALQVRAAGGTGQATSCLLVGVHQAVGRGARLWVAEGLLESSPHKSRLAEGAGGYSYSAEARAITDINVIDVPGAVEPMHGPAGGLGRGGPSIVFAGGEGGNVYVLCIATSQDTAGIGGRVEVAGRVACPEEHIGKVSLVKAMSVSMVAVVYAGQPGTVWLFASGSSASLWECCGRVTAAEGLGNDGGGRIQWMSWYAPWPMTSFLAVCTTSRVLVVSPTLSACGQGSRQGEASTLPVLWGMGVRECVCVEWSPDGQMLLVCAAGVTLLAPRLWSALLQAKPLDACGASRVDFAGPDAMLLSKVDNAGHGLLQPGASVSVAAREALAHVNLPSPWMQAGLDVDYVSCVWCAGPVLDPEQGSDGCAAHGAICGLLRRIRDFLQGEEHGLPDLASILPCPRVDASGPVEQPHASNSGQHEGNEARGTARLSAASVLFGHSGASGRADATIDSLGELCSQVLRLLREREEEDRELPHRHAGGDCAGNFQVETEATSRGRLKEWLESLVSVVDSTQGAVWDYRAQQFLVAHRMALRSSTGLTLSTGQPHREPGGGGVGYAGTHDGVRFGHGSASEGNSGGRALEEKNDTLAPMSSVHVAWALLSGCSSPLLAAVDNAERDSPEVSETAWTQVSTLKAPLWVESHAELQSIAEARSKALFAQTRDPCSCALLYLALDKRSMLAAMFKAVNQAKMAAFFARDFEVVANRQAAMKNACTLLSQHKFELAAAFFLLAGSSKDAITTLLEKKGDAMLALLLVRLVNEHPRAHSMLSPKGSLHEELTLIERHLIAHGDIVGAALCQWRTGRLAPALLLLARASDAAHMWGGMDRPLALKRAGEFLQMAAVMQSMARHPLVVRALKAEAVAAEKDPGSVEAEGRDQVAVDAEGEVKAEDGQSGSRGRGIGETEALLEGVDVSGVKKVLGLKAAEETKIRALGKLMLKDPRLLALVGQEQQALQLAWDIENGRATFGGDFVTPPDTCAIASMIASVEAARESPATHEQEVSGDSSPPPATNNGGEPSEDTGLLQEGISGISDAVRGCESGVRRLRRRACSLLVIAGAADLALSLSAPLHASLSPHRPDHQAPTAGEEEAGEGALAWERLAEKLVIESCLLCAVRQRLSPTPDWISPWSLQGKDVELLPRQVTSVRQALTSCATHIGEEMAAKEQGWVQRLAEGECVAAQRLDCLVALRLRATWSGQKRVQAEFADVIEWTRFVSAALVRSLPSAVLLPVRVRTSTSTASLLRLAERLSVAACLLAPANEGGLDSCHSDAAASSYSGGPMADVAELTASLLTACFAIVFSVVWLSRDTVALQVLLEENDLDACCNFSACRRGSNVSESAGDEMQAAQTSSAAAGPAAEIAIGRFSRRALMRLAAHDSTHDKFAWCNRLAGFARRDAGPLWSDDGAREGAAASRSATPVPSAALDGGRHRSVDQDSQIGARAAAAQDVADYALDGLALLHVHGLMQAVYQRSADNRRLAGAGAGWEVWVRDASHAANLACRRLRGLRQARACSLATCPPGPVAKRYEGPASAHPPSDLRPDTRSALWSLVAAWPRPPPPPGLASVPPSAWEEREHASCLVAAAQTRHADGALGRWAEGDRAQDQEWAWSLGLPEIICPHQEAVRAVCVLELAADDILRSHIGAGLAPHQPPPALNVLIAMGTDKRIRPTDHRASWGAAASPASTLEHQAPSPSASAPWSATDSARNDGSFTGGHESKQLGAAVTAVEGLFDSFYQKANLLASGAVSGAVQRGEQIKRLAREHRPTSSHSRPVGGLAAGSAVPSRTNWTHARTEGQPRMALLSAGVVLAHPSLPVLIAGGRNGSVEVFRAADLPAADPCMAAMSPGV